MASSQKLKFIFKPEKLSDFLSKLEELTKIEDVIKVKIDSQNILMYSILGGNVMLAFKNFLVKTDDYFTDSNLDFTLDLVLASSKKLVKNLNFLVDSKKVTFEINYKDTGESTMSARSIQITDGKFKFNWLAGENYEMRDITKEALKNNLNIKNRRWSFQISKSDFADVKKLSNINSEKIINIAIDNGKVVLSERASWELEVQSIEAERNANLMLNKKFLSCINESSDVEFSIFDSFMLISEENSNLMLSFEQSFDDD
jgi:hypothetical protein